MRPIDRPAFAYRSEPGVPAFDEERILLVMDGNCALCSFAARHAARLDHQDRIRIATADSPLGTALLRLYGLNPEDPESWLMIEGGRAFGSLDAMLRLSAGLHPLFRLATPLRWLPFAVQDWLYARLARNRYALFGRTDMCALPDPALRRKLVP